MSIDALATASSLRGSFTGRRYQRHVLVTEGADGERRKRRAFRDAIDAGVDPDTIAWTTTNGAAIDAGTNPVHIGKGYNLLVITGDRTNGAVILNVGAL